ncbi:MAG: triose-phosphate isomerase [Polyangiaceae bacterium]|nr:triose-phosphate isomerase [Polyangiaceae bacterium]MCL4750245.1 triose-phosphate isomerase [Myxococcales bacterium]
MNRTPIIAGNWKMYKGGSAGPELARAIVTACGDLAGVSLVLAPPFTVLAEVVRAVSGSRVEVAGQNLYPKPEGAFTGEVSAPMLLDAGCKWVIIGHSERRQFFGETDEGVREKTAAAMAAGLRPIVCIGETLAERDAGKTLDVVHRQLDAFSSVLAERPGFGTIAYEPVWAIGTGKVAGPEQAQEVHHALRQRLTQKDATLGRSTHILYGGSVKPDNASGLLSCPDVDGALVGGASLDAGSFAKIVEACPSRV